jgi:hypothetical protein
MLLEINFLVGRMLIQRDLDELRPRSIDAAVGSAALTTPRFRIDPSTSGAVSVVASCHIKQTASERSA